MTQKMNHAADRATGLVVLLIAIACSRLLTMYYMPLADLTEPRYAEIARVMAETGDWITPWFDHDTPFWGKPPLSFWLAAASFRLFGVSDFTARLPSWLITIATGYLVYLVAKQMNGRREALWSLLIFASMPAVYIAGGTVMTDPFLMLGITLSVASLCMMFEGRAAGWRWLFFVGIAIGLLAKGPVAIVILGVGITMWLLWTRNWRLLLSGLPWFRGTLLMLALTVPWYIAAELKTPGFLEYYILGEHFYRFIDTGWKGDLYGIAHKETRGTIWLFFLYVTLPWGLTVLAVLGYRMIRKNAAGRSAPVSACNSTDSLLVCCALAPAVFFTLSGNILWTYLLPGLPPFALMAGKLLVKWLDRRSAFSPTRLVPVLLFPLTISIVVLYASLKTGIIESEKDLVNEYNRIRTENSEPLRYIGVAPFSARFYSAGKVKQLALDDAINMANTQTAKDIYLAVRDDQIKEFKNRCPQKCRMLASDLRYTLVVVPADSTDPWATR